MTAEKLRHEAGCMGALWGFANALIAVVLVATFISGGNDILAGLFLLIAFLPAVIAGTVFGFRGALHYLPLLRPFRLSNEDLLRATGLAFGVPAALIAAFSLPFNPCIPPSDETLLADFRRNETELNRIVDKTLRDTGHRTFQHRPLEKVGISNGLSVSETGDEILFYNWITGSAISSDAMKGFAYLSHPPKKTQRTLNNYAGKGKFYKIYRHIKGNWYLFYKFIPG